VAYLPSGHYFRPLFSLFFKDALRATPFQTPQQIAPGFKPVSRTRVSEILETLTILGQTRQGEEICRPLPSEGYWFGKTIVLC
jgi:hypothetical protein